MRGLAGCLLTRGLGRTDQDPGEGVPVVEPQPKEAVWLGVTVSSSVLPEL